MNEQFEALKSVKEYMVNLINGIERAVEYFQAGEERKACELISPITEGIQWMSEALMLTKNIHHQDITLQDMNEKLKEIVEAFENEDFILIADLFEYELKPILEDIQKNINKVVVS
ncbi:hypothetical protein [Clostridium estertheticum]|uniref:DUF8042 domain-containing protein n=1 Tax=Clostridium estertheticum subsp. estertheticum TaxID=1552 RepID=A0A1J0GIG3_9CLOT|nr:hypothetical protein [Clostridium estertheticum]APC41170.1 hypothetical protein A7L45_14350 [Clostridium estertheticum subsp. estertheticum]MBU3074180.1 hypothetical protein [Clostridium estertheticum]MBU3164274.1 hypothetical protein [Clostridium estertheticum]